MLEYDYEIDAEVAKRILKWVSYDDACEIIEAIAAEGLREKFLNALQEVIYLETGNKSLPEWLMFQLTPRRICLAALRIYGVEVK